jgi:hypothetical protein
MYLKDGAIAVGGATLLFLISGYLTGGIVFYLALILSLAVLIVDYARLRHMRSAVGSILVTRSMPRRHLPLGSTTVLASRLEYSGNKLLKLSITQPLNRSIRSDGGRRWLTMDRGSVFNLDITLKPSKCGDFRIRPMKAEFESWLFRDIIPIGGEEQFSVNIDPGTSTIRKSTGLRSNSKYSDVFGSIGEHQGGSDFSSVRHYIAGDSIKNIDWAISGRVGSLVVRQYEEDHMLPVYFLIDVDESMGTGDKTELESAVGLVAMLTDKLRIDNESVGMACFSREEVVNFIHLGMSRDHVTNMKNILSTIKPVASSCGHSQPGQYSSEQELRLIGQAFEDDCILSTVIGETLKGYRANVKQDGFSRAVLKASQSATTACHIVVITNLSMGMTSLLNGIRIAGYYGHSVSVVLTPHVWYKEKELIDMGHYYEEYMALKNTIQKLRGSSVKVIDLSSAEKPEDIIYASRIKSRQTGIRG